MDTAAILVAAAFAILTAILIVVMASQPKRHARCRVDLGKVLAIRCGYCGDLCVRPLHAAPGACEVCDTPLAGMPWAVEDKALLIERLTNEVMEGDAD